MTQLVNSFHLSWDSKLKPQSTLLGSALAGSHQPKGPREITIDHMGPLPKVVAMVQKKRKLDLLGLDFFFCCPSHRRHQAPCLFRSRVAPRRWRLCDGAPAWVSDSRGVRFDASGKLPLASAPEQYTFTHINSKKQNI